MLSYFIIHNGHQNSSTNLIHSAAFLQRLSWVMFVPSCNVWESMSLKDFTTWFQRRYLTWSASKMWRQEKAGLVLSCCRSSQLCWHRGNSLCDSTLDFFDPIPINKRCLDIKTLLRSVHSPMDRSALQLEPLESNKHLTESNPKQHIFLPVLWNTIIAVAQLILQRQSWME